jgi:hypothetical protein
VARSTLADANEKRDWRIFADFAQRLVTAARSLYVDEPLGLEELDQRDTTVYAFGRHHDRSLPVGVPLGSLPENQGRGGGGTSAVTCPDRISYALGGAPDNPEMESFNGRFKVENRSLLLDAETLEDLTRVVRNRIDHYNRRRRHSSIGYRHPLDYAHTVLPNLFRVLFVESRLAISGAIP